MTNNIRWCIAPECDNPIKSRGLCAKHYERWRAHGDFTIDNRAGIKITRMNCTVQDCKRKATYIKNTLCNIHYLRKYRHGGFESKIPNYGQGWHLHESGYIRILVKGKFKMEHVYLAEKALGKELPPKAVIHHMNENKTDNHTPFNLIICPDQAYHFLLHKRAKLLRLGLL